MSVEELKTYSKELHKPVIKTFERRTVSTMGNDDTWAIDLADVHGISDKNDNYTFILTVIDIYSRYAWAYPLLFKDKHHSVVPFENLKRLPKNMWADQGGEFFNGPFKEFCKKHDINLYHTYSGLKSVYVERFNRTLKEKMYKYFTANRTKRYIDKLDEWLKEYNHSIHRTTKQTPYDIYFGNAIPFQKIDEEVKVKDEKPKDIIKPIKPLFNVGNYVRTTKNKGIFGKGYEAGWRKEVLVVRTVDTSQIPIMFELADLMNENIDGKFYTEELQLSKLPHLFLFQKLLDQKKEGRALTYLIQYEGYPVKFDKWVDKAELDRLTEGITHTIENGLIVLVFKKLLEKKKIGRVFKYHIKYKDYDDTFNQWVGVLEFKRLTKGVNPTVANGLK